MYHIVASDLDGTLLSPDHRLTPFTYITLQNLVALDIHFVFATGRHYIDVGQIRDKLGIPAYMITSNGARVHDINGKLIFSHDLNTDIANELYYIKYDDKLILTHVYRNDEWFISRHTPDEQDYFPESVFRYQIYQPSVLPVDGISKVFFTCKNPLLLNSLEESIQTRWGDRVNVSFSLPTCLEVMAGGVSKGHALKSVAKNLGYSLEKCIAFGDGMNDFEMLSMVGKGCIMYNANQRLKDMLPTLEVIGSNADETVPHILHKLFLASQLKSN
ncbi:sugar/pyridoxal phosphate phosphatase YigL [Pantoea sp. Aalb]|uniref:sugar/pyridoxal phosphate phosphatase YigL n=1 Tax=Pantoea sp. Aalb TaxID=2576762 RepID=UPI0013283293|nr:sugar/pyridoxal phosphate phosphatase YigL [Pantoea sp. Aalb]MXP67652.1 sugar/pyridoxal phosphate phosphatase YigL [Pantoea sp. Aalb]